MQELVIVVPDLYLTDATPGRAALPILPSLDALARRGDLTAVTEGWRGWLARWAGLAELAALPPAAIAAAALTEPLPGGLMAWIASPLHLVPGLSSVRLDPRGLLALSDDDVAALVEDFAAAFAGSGFELHRVPWRSLLLAGPAIEDVRTHDPARWLGASILPAQPQGSGGLLLQRLGSEIEMWLHEHELNARRARRGALAVNALWPWGGGSTARAQLTRPLSAIGSLTLPAAFGDDAWLHGAWRLAGSAAGAAAPGLEPVIAAGAVRAVVVHPVFRSSDAGAPLAPSQLLERFDAGWIAPAAAALRVGRLNQLTVIAGDVAVHAKPAHSMRFWRRPRRWLEQLQ